jgi:asparagine synthase (glutamine-hydrolysing)
MPTLDGYRTWVGFFDESARCQLVPGADDWALRDYASQWALSSGATPLDRLLALNATTYLLDDLLIKADRMSMAHALEVRSPFLDIELLDLAFRLPPHVKLRRYRRKLALVEGVRDVLPSEILRRRKRGFAVPLDHWFREDLQDYLGAMIGSPKARLREHMRTITVDRLMAEHRSSQRNHGQRLWLLLALELFLRREGW